VLEQHEYFNFRAAFFHARTHHVRPYHFSKKQKEWDATTLWKSGAAVQMHWINSESLQHWRETSPRQHIKQTKIFVLAPKLQRYEKEETLSHDERERTPTKPYHFFPTSNTSIMRDTGRN
jgi:hypothetical protein